MGSDALESYALNGYYRERAVFGSADVDAMVEHYMELRAKGPHPGDSSGVEGRTIRREADPLRGYPRMINMHLWDSASARWMNSPRLRETASALLAQPAEILQTMVYFKPPGSRGQAFHQDNVYLKITPIMGAWVALDPAGGENGGMTMVRGSHLLGLLPVEQADTDLYFTATHSAIAIGTNGIHQKISVPVILNIRCAKATLTATGLAVAIAAIMAVIVVPIFAPSV